MQTVSSSLQSQILHCDNLSLPLRDESVDAALSIAVIHHIATAERRVRALRELSRVLRVGGRVIISVWAMEQRHRKVSQCVCRSKEEGLTGLSKVTMSFYKFKQYDFQGVTLGVHPGMNNLQYGASGERLGWVDLDLGSSPSWWAASVATYCPSRAVEDPKFNSTQRSL